MHDGIDGECRNALHAQFVHDVLAVGDDRRQANVQPVGNLLVDIALHNQRHDLDFAVGENALVQQPGQWRHVVPVRVPMVLQHQQGADKVFFRLVDVEAMEAAELGSVACCQCEDNGLALALDEEGTVVQDDVHRYEVVEVAVGLAVLEFSKRTERVDRHNRQHVEQQLLQAQYRQGIGVDDGYLRSSCGHRLCSICS